MCSLPVRPSRACRRHPFPGRRRRAVREGDQMSGASRPPSVPRRPARSPSAATRPSTGRRQLLGARAGANPAVKDAEPKGPCAPLRACSTRCGIYWAAGDGRGGRRTWALYPRFINWTLAWKWGSEFLGRWSRYRTSGRSSSVSLPTLISHVITQNCFYLGLAFDLGNGTTFEYIFYTRKKLSFIFLSSRWKKEIFFLISWFS
jgi:hypothetical protein